MAIVGNSDLANDFNASWASKLIICCDETKIDKQVVVEKIKSLSTADKIFMNAKGKDHVELSFFGKFILLTNNEENFIYVDREETRFWIRNVPPISSNQRNVGILTEMIEEIPAFLDFLNKRKMATERLDRMWFHPMLIKTEALDKVVSFSQPAVEKEIRTYIAEMFKDFGCDEIMMSTHDIRKEVFNNRYEQNYILKILKDRVGVDHYKNEADKYVIHRYEYPKWDTIYKDGKPETNRVDIHGRGRPFVFMRDGFLTEEEQSNLEIDPELSQLNSVSNLTGQTSQNGSSEPHSLSGDKTDKLPF